MLPALLRFFVFLGWLAVFEAVNFDDVAFKGDEVSAVEVFVVNELGNGVFQVFWGQPVGSYIEPVQVRDDQNLVFRTQETGELFTFIM